MHDLLIDGSPNRDDTPPPALLRGKKSQTSYLPDCRTGCCGRQPTDDNFDQAVTAMEGAEATGLSSPLYRHNICGGVRNLPDRVSHYVREGGRSGRRRYLLFQGAAPEQRMSGAGSCTLNLPALLYSIPLLRYGHRPARSGRAQQCAPMQPERSLIWNMSLETTASKRRSWATACFRCQMRTVRAVCWRPSTWATG